MHVTDIESKVAEPLTARLIDIAYMNAIARVRFRRGRKNKWPGLTMAATLRAWKETEDARAAWEAIGKIAGQAAEAFRRFESAAAPEAAPQKYCTAGLRRPGKGHGRPCSALAVAGSDRCHVHGGTAHGGRDVRAPRPVGKALIFVDGEYVGMSTGEVKVTLKV